MLWSRELGRWWLVVHFKYAGGARCQKMSRAVLDRTEKSDKIPLKFRSRSRILTIPFLSPLSKKADEAIDGQKGIIEHKEAMKVAIKKTS